MKKLLYLVVLILITISSCTIIYEAISSAQMKQEQIVTAKELQLSIENPVNQSKEKALPVSFMEVTNDQVSEGTMIIVAGEIDLILSQEGPFTEFSLSVYEEHGYGVYVIQDVSGTELKEGDVVRVYGFYEGDFKYAPIPIVHATDIEVY